MTVLNQHAGFKQKKTTNKQLYPAQTPTSTSPLVSWGWGGGQHIVIFYVVILLHVYGGQKGLLPGHKLVKPGHYVYLENSLICMIFQSALLTVWFAAHFILCHGMISAQT